VGLSFLLKSLPSISSLRCTQAPKATCDLRVVVFELGRVPGPEYFLVDFGSRYPLVPVDGGVLLMAVLVLRDGGTYKQFCIEGMDQT